ncbi:30S ribosomal protein S7 [Enterobacteriaceae bacterium ET-AT1-13]|nr:30S ribosomal protein S7 [Enterobacteriaceae bacterium ET-AT1-13]WGS66386.1 30S ribosomal protein S7 [Enterobacteriaceae bacterium Cmel17]WMC17412.1 MAG: 30S ribosomal protein S7 [Enterobacteriaceae bacterium Cmel21]WMC17618.1 MAG: 30S ribosomal protein S7 [Enterobacteriaceae bacterium PSmelAO3-2]WMC17823.1 MAG: 30S ribosomal protein S7 [Enterobacteriaceae bacterium PSmelAO3-1]WMC18026.1 MAG: 30S ribosomal protein S7 [Enterobacteriaceae bacterium PSmelAO1]
MSRKKKIKKHKILPDPKFKSKLLTKFINIIMVNGKKTLAQSIVYNALENLINYTKNFSLEVFKKAIINIGPLVEVKSRKIGGANYQVPIEVNLKRRNSLAMRWIIKAAQKRKNKSMSLKLSNELFDASNNKGLAFKKRENVHKMAEANKAFAHYKW